MSSSGTRQFRPGTLVAQYRVEREIGRGAMGVVYLAVQEKLERKVALKILNESLSRDAEFVGRFFNEARAAASLSHPKIIQAYDAGLEEPDLYYFAMEYIEGDTLLDRMRREGTLKVPVALQVALDIADALNYGWKRQKLVHGDLKPENIMVSVQGETKLADFGLAKVIDHDFTGDGIMLTPLYAAPELIRGEAKAADCRSDIYSFGAALYHVLSGEPPFPGTDPKTVLKRHLTETPVPLMARNSAVSREVSDYVGQLLAKDPANRPQDWEQVLTSLHWLHSRRILPGAQKQGKVFVMKTAQPVARPKTRDNSWLWVFLIAALALLGAALWFILSNQRPASVPPTAPPPAFTQAQEVALQEWREAKLACDRDRNAIHQIRILEEYQKTHPTWVPLEFYDYLRKCRQQVMQKPEVVKPPEPRPPEVVPPDVKPPPPPEPKPAPAEVKPEPPPVKPAPVNPEQQAQAADRADNYAALVYDVYRAFAKWPTTLEPLLQTGQKWLEKYPDATGEHDRVRLFMDGVFPGFDEYVAKLVTHKDKLVGTLLPVRKYDGKPIKDITLTEVVLKNKTDYGDVALRLPWGELDRLLVLTTFGKTAFADLPQTIQDRKAYLAFLLLTRQFDLLNEQLAGIPEGADKRLWLIVRDDLVKAEVEGKALTAWRDAVRAAEKREYGPCFRALQELRAANTAVGFRHQADIEAMYRVCVDRVPEALAPALVEKAQDLLMSDPKESLQILNLVQVRYGRLDFPERRELERLRNKALDLLSETMPIERGAREDGELRPHPFRTFMPGLDSVDRPFPGASAVQYRRLQSRDDLPPVFRLAMPALYGLVLLDLGDWDGARKVFTERTGTPPVDVPGHMHAALAFGRAVVAARFGENVMPVDVVMQKLADARRKRGEDEWLDGQTKLLMSDYLIFTREWKATPAPWPPLAEIAEKASDANYSALLMSALTYELEAGRKEKAVAAMRNVKDRREGDLLMLGALGGYLADGPGKPPLRTDLPRLTRGRYARLLLDAGLSRDTVKPAELRAFLKDTAQMFGDDTWVGAGACFDAALLQIALEVQAKNLPAAQQLAKAALARTSPYLSAYYPRLRFLQAGLEILAGTPGLAQDTLASLNFATVASAAELQLVGSPTGSKSDKGGDAKPPAPDVSSSAESQFWAAWLRWCRAVSAAEEPRATDAARQMARATRSLADRHFVDLLAPGAAAGR